MNDIFGSNGLRAGALLFALAACHSASSTDQNATACTTTSTSAGAGSSSGSGAGGGSPTGGAHVRLFNFVGPQIEASAIDYCYQPASSVAGDAWIGPVYRDAHTYPKYGNVAPYVSLPADQMRVRLVPWGASECEATIEGAGGDLELDQPFGDGKYSTLVVSGWLIAGKNGVPLTPLAASILDDNANFGDHELSVRVLNMDPTAGGLDVWKAPKDSDPSTWELVMDKVPFGEVGVASKSSPFGATDAKGYLTQMPSDWPVAILYNLALCPHGNKTKCWITGWQPIQGNWTVFSDKTNADSWGYNFINDGAKLADPNQPRMVQSDSWW